MDKTKLITIYLETAVQVELSLDASLESYEPSRVVSAELMIGDDVFQLKKKTCAEIGRDHLSFLGTTAIKQMEYDEKLNFPCF